MRRACAADACGRIRTAEGSVRTIRSNPAWPSCTRRSVDLLSTVASDGVSGHHLNGVTAQRESPASVRPDVRPDVLPGFRARAAITAITAGRPGKSGKPGKPGRQCGSGRYNAERDAA
jgi:hypothetical protein